MAYNSDRKGYETIDGGLIRINGDDKVRIDIYDGNEREKGGHTRDTINYEIAPIIVDAIDKIQDNDSIYNYIYKNIVNVCVTAIKKGDYDFAYNRYKNSVLILEEQFARPVLEQRLVKVLKLSR